MLKWEWNNSVNNGNIYNLNVEVIVTDSQVIVLVIVIYIQSQCWGNSIRYI